MRLKGRVALVTGASRGIGAAIADSFQREGATVISVARSMARSSDVLTEASQEASTTLSSAPGEGIEPMAFDFASASVEQIRGLVSIVVARFGSLDIVVNNAGIIRRSAAVDFAERDWDDVLKVNLKAPFFLAQAAAKWWIEAGAARSTRRMKIINIASLLSFPGGINVASYAAAKHGIAGITRALANEWSSQRINVNAIAPGYVETENTRALRENEARNRQILERIPQGAWGKPQEISPAVVFLASSDSDYLNGAVINVDGGWLAR